MKPSTLAAALLLAVAAPAQTLVVDANNGPGTHFTSLAAACSAAPDGATLDVRPGAYGTFSISGKSLRVLARPGARALIPLMGSAAIGNVGAGKTVVVRGLQFATANNTPSLFTLYVGNSQGAVLLEELEILSGQQMRFAATDCAQLFVKNLRNQGVLQMELTRCQSLLEGTRVGAVVGMLMDAPGIRCTSGSLQVVDCTVQGLMTLYTAARPGIELQQADLRLLGNTSVGSGFSWTQPATFAVTGQGNVRSEPGVQFSSSAGAFAPTLNVTQPAMPTLTARLVGNTTTASLRSPVGQLGMLVLGLPGPALTLPGITDPLWLDPASFGHVVVGTVGTGLPVQGVVTIPANAMRGSRLTWQAVTLDPAAGLQLSNASFVVVP